MNTDDAGGLNYPFNLCNLWLNGLWLPTGHTEIGRELSTKYTKVGGSETEDVTEGTER